MGTLGRVGRSIQSSKHKVKHPLCAAGRPFQAVALAKRPHVVVGTPGRVVDHLSNTKGFSLKTLKHLVLDEADRLLNMDFEQEIDQILKVIPKASVWWLGGGTGKGRDNFHEKKLLEGWDEVLVDAQGHPQLGGKCLALSRWRARPRRRGERSCSAQP